MPMLKTPREELFCHEYVVDMNATRSAIAAGYSEKTASQIGYILLQRPDIKKRIRQITQQLTKRIRVQAKDVLEEWCKIASFNPNDLSQNRIGACRFCHGLDGRYQWKTAREFEAEVGAVANKLRLDETTVAQILNGLSEDDPRFPNARGGFGYSIAEEPNPKCAECNGLGIQYPFFPDTRDLGSEAAAAYRGVKVTKNGIEVMQADKDRALENLAKHLNMFVERGEVDIGEQTRKFLAQIMGGKAPLQE